MKTAIKKIVDRLRQPSSVMGLTALGVLVGLPAETLNHLGTAIVFLAGIAGVLLDDAPAVVVVAADPPAAPAATIIEGPTP